MLGHSEVIDHRFHVVVLASYAPSLVTFRGPMIEAMVRQGWRVTAAAPLFDAATVAQVESFGAEVAQVDLARTGMNPLSDIAYYWNVRRLIRRLKPDALFAYTAKPVIWGALSGRGMKSLRIVALITGLGYAFTEGQKFSAKQRLARVAASILYWLALSRADRILFQNPDDRDLFINARMVRDDGRVDVINGSGVDVAHFAPVELPDQTVFLMTARLLGAKGVREYAQAAMILKARYPHAVFRLAGWIDPGPDSIDERELRAWCDGGIEYLGRLTDVRPAVAGARVFVLPSYREGTPRTVLEAMAMGRAIVTSDAPGCRETVVDGHNGFLVPPRETEVLVEAMERFILEPALAERMGDASLALVREKYNVHKVNAHILAAVR